MCPIHQTSTSKVLAYSTRVVAPKHTSARLACLPSVDNVAGSHHPSAGVLAGVAHAGGSAPAPAPAILQSYIGSVNCADSAGSFLMAVHIILH